MGDDTQRDKVIIESLDSVKKKLTIENFGKRDKLIIEGEKYGYKTLRELDGIHGTSKLASKTTKPTQMQISFQALSSSDQIKPNPTRGQSNNTKPSAKADGFLLSAGNMKPRIIMSRETQANKATKYQRSKGQGRVFDNYKNTSNTRDIEVEAAKNAQENMT